MKAFQGKTIFITGAASGIGKATAIAFAAKGANVILGDINETAGKSLEKEIQSMGSQAFFAPCDVSRLNDLKTVVAKGIEEFGSLDYAFNNAGLESSEPNFTADYSEELWMDIININLSGVWRAMKAELEVMKTQKCGVIINNASILGKVGFRTAAPYSASKHGVIGLSKTAAIEYAKKGIRVNAICPGFIQTPMLDRLGITGQEKAQKSIEAMHPMGRLGTPEEIAAAVLWLCSDAASFVTGTAFNVDGGYLAQ